MPVPLLACTEHVKVELANRDTMESTSVEQHGTTAAKAKGYI